MGREAQELPSPPLGKVGGATCLGADPKTVGADPKTVGGDPRTLGTDPRTEALEGSSSIGKAVAAVV